MLISRVRFSFSFSLISSFLSFYVLESNPTLEIPLAYNCASCVRDLCAIHFFAFILPCHIHIHIHAATVHVCVPLPVPAGLLLPD
ncbi:hypothetical protein F5148DRAFT_1249480, partial [Russula earlei]